MKGMMKALGIASFLFWVTAAHAETYVLQFGINDYPGTESDLKGCVNDVLELKQVLIDKLNVKESNVKTYIDSAVDKAGFLGGFQWLVDNAKPGDQVVFQYSGHGGQLETKDLVAEPDGKEEVICLADDTLVSGSFFNQIASDLKSRGIDSTFVIDSCFSGGMSRPTTGFKVKGKNLQVSERHQRTLGVLSLSRTKDKVPAESLKALRQAAKAKLQPPVEGSTAFLLAASEDKPSADLEFKGDTPAHGAFTYILLAALNVDAQMSVEAIMKSIVQILKENNFEQGPVAEYSSEKRQTLPLVINP